MSSFRGEFYLFFNDLSKFLFYFRVSEFEYTRECIIFDLLRIPLYHGWLVDPAETEVTRAIGSLSYNQLVDRIITYKGNSNSSSAPADPVISSESECFYIFS